MQHAVCNVRLKYTHVCTYKARVNMCVKCGIVLSFNCTLWQWVVTQNGINKCAAIIYYFNEMVHLINAYIKWKRTRYHVSCAQKCYFCCFYKCCTIFLTTGNTSNRAAIKLSFQQCGKFQFFSYATYFIMITQLNTINIKIYNWFISFLKYFHYLWNMFSIKSKHPVFTGFSYFFFHKFFFTQFLGSISLYALKTKIFKGLFP